MISYLKNIYRCSTYGIKTNRKCCQTGGKYEKEKGEEGEEIRKSNTIMILPEIGGKIVGRRL